jgi:electron transport complex protein RnfC
MYRHDFRLGTLEAGPLGTIGVPHQLRIVLECHEPLVNQGDEVAADQRIARSTRSGVGDMHSAYAGKIISVHDESITLETGGKEVSERIHPPDDDSALRDWLATMGMNTAHIYPSRLLIINNVPREPGHDTVFPLMNDQRKALENGLDIIKKVVRPAKTVLAAAKGTRVLAFADSTVHFVPARHPYGMAPMVLLSVTGEETVPGGRPSSACIVSLEDLYIVGRMAESGRPFTHTVCQMGNRTVMVPVGTPAEHLLAEGQTKASEGDRVVFGGLLTGTAVSRLEQGTDKNTSAVHVIPEDLFPPTRDASCVGCGECSRRCPSRIRPDLVSRASEFKLYERCEAYGVFSCIECGICGYFCPVRRPLLQYIRHAKHEINLQKGQCEILEAPA